MSKEKMAAAFRMSAAEILFNDALARCFTRWNLILSFRITSAAGLATARQRIATEKVTFVNDLLHRPEYDKILIDKQEFFKEHPPEQIVQQMTDATIELAQIAGDAASIVFTQSVLDGAAFDYCRVTALIAPTEWEPTVSQRRMKLADLRDMNYNQILESKLAEYFEQLDRESLLKKADLLLARCRPPEKWSPMENYAYDRQRLERLDQYRHDLIHGEGLGKGLASAEEETEFMMKTAMYFMGLVNLRYGLKINPVYVFSAMADFKNYLKFGANA